MVRFRALVLSAASCAALAAMLAPAMAIDCQADVAAFTARRQVYINQLNGSSSKTKGKLDPVAACPRLRSLAAVEGQLVAYMVKNKDWCHIPDEAMANVSAGRNRTASLAGKACGMASQIAKLKRQQAAQQASGGIPGAGGPPQAPRLPAGPL